MKLEAIRGSDLKTDIQFHNKKNNINPFDQIHLVVFIEIHTQLLFR